MRNTFSDLVEMIIYCEALIIAILIAVVCDAKTYAIIILISITFLVMVCTMAISWRIDEDITKYINTCITKYFDNKEE
ncbi:MAG: hypothetical protein MJZ20_11535 [Bacteroidaceae bacterium]|nr:hypothetical protein [Bacteroidaceae bacterium]